MTKEREHYCHMKHWTFSWLGRLKCATPSNTNQERKKTLPKPPYSPLKLGVTSSPKGCNFSNDSLYNKVGIRWTLQEKCSRYGDRLRLNTIGHTSVDSADLQLPMDLEIEVMLSSNHIFMLHWAISNTMDWKKD